MKTEFDVVDLGVKKAGALMAFLKREGPALLGKAMPSCSRSSCLGIEGPSGEEFRSVVEQQGFQFRISDLSKPEQREQLPMAKVYLAWHLLEHLPVKEHSSAVVATMCRKASQLVWLRLPSFESADLPTNESALRKHGLRFTWTTWKCHRVPWEMSDCFAAFNQFAADCPARSKNLVVRPAAVIVSSEDPRVVPITAPPDTLKYHKGLGKKPLVRFDKNPVVAEWDVILQFNC